MGEYPLFVLPGLRWCWWLLVTVAVAVGWFLALLLAGVVALSALAVASVEAAARWVVASAIGACEDEDAQPVTAVLLVVLAIVALRAALGR